MRLLLFSLFLSFNLYSTVYVRYNEVGYVPKAEKKLVLMSDSALEGKQWFLKNAHDSTVMKGVFGVSACDTGAYMPMKFNYKVDFSAIAKEGNYTFVLGAVSKKIEIKKDAYVSYIPEIVRYFRVQRSGSEEALDHAVSHLRDSACVVYERVNNANNQWQKRKAGKIMVDMKGGWYDAGDYLKVTLTTAYATYQILRAYESNPALFAKIYSKSKLPDILDEAKHGLDYLMKVMPDSSTFIIQVANQIDHRVGDRLPEDDMLDGARGAYSCLSQTQMGYTAAALALGADVFTKYGELELANKYKEMAEKVYAAARKSSQSPAWYEFENEHFYDDKSKHDNMALAATELYKLTKGKNYLKELKEYAAVVGSGGWFAWGNDHAMANLRMDEVAQTSLTPVVSDLKIFTYESRKTNNLWEVPHQFTWGSLYSFLGVANASLLYTKQSKDSTYLRNSYNVVDYLFGKNNWGVSFVASKNLPNTVHNVYSQIYRLQPKLFPSGAVSEGPGDMKSHLEVKQYYKYSSENHPSNKFNTSAIVFYDENTNFQCMETTIVGLSDALLFLTLYSAYVK